MSELAEFELEVPGPFAIHNFPCPVCQAKPAVYVLNTGVMEPCWSCQEKGWQTRCRRWRPWGKSNQVAE